MRFWPIYRHKSDATVLVTRRVVATSAQKADQGETEQDGDSDRIARPSRRQCPFAGNFAASFAASPIAPALVGVCRGPMCARPGGRYVTVDVRNSCRPGHSACFHREHAGEASIWTVQIHGK